MTGPGYDVLGTFGGPGGWPEGGRRLGLREVGVELDAAACATRRAAGHLTVRADVARFPVKQLAGKTRGQTHSPPCTTFSAAGDQAGNALLEMLAALTRDMFAGRDSRAECRREMAAELTRSEWASDLDEAPRAAKVTKAVASAALVAEPARFILAGEPEWVALEQVPAVLPLWQVYAAELRRMGYSAWTGKLNAADYGVPQTRERAILIASRVRQVARPEPTHYDDRKAMQLWGTPWISMADALGWGAVARPSVSVTAGGTATGGAEPFGHRGRDALEAERDAGRWVLHANRDQRADGSRQTADPQQPAPALTSKSGGQWVLRTGNNTMKHSRTGSRAGDGGVVAYERGTDQPSPTLDTMVGAKWTLHRPATTVQGDPLVGRPGHKDRDKGERQFEQDSVRITVREAAILQSFPADYPWQGTKTKQFEQCGNAVPPRLAAHILSMATGIPLALPENEAAA